MAGRCAASRTSDRALNDAAVLELYLHRLVRQLHQEPGARETGMPKSCIRMPLAHTQ